MTVNINTGEIDDLYSGIFWGSALDPESAVLAFIVRPWQEQESALPTGLYLKYPWADAPNEVQTGEWDHVWWDPEVHRFIANGEPGALVLTSEGEVTVLENGRVVVGSGSPNGEWLVVSSNGYLLVEPNGDLPQDYDLTTEEVYELLWRPDSQGLFFSTPTGLYYRSISNPNPAQLDDRRVSNLGWVGDATK